MDKAGKMNILLGLSCGLTGGAGHLQDKNMSILLPMNTGKRLEEHREFHMKSSVATLSPSTPNRELTFLGYGE